MNFNTVFTSYWTCLESLKTIIIWSIAPFTFRPDYEHKLLHIFFYWEEGTVQKSCISFAATSQKGYDKITRKKRDN